MRSIFVVGSIFAALAACAQDLPREPVSYRESFETGEDPVRFWTSNGEHEVNFKGLTDERAFDGQRSFKLDVTLKSGSYFYWDVPLNLIAEGDLEFSARVYVAQGNNADVGVGLNWIYPPTHHSGCGPIESYRQPADEWRLIEANLGEISPARAQGVLDGWVAGASVANIGMKVDRWGIFVKGSPGQRLLVYLDDVRIEGQAPEAEAYEAAVAARWSPFTAAWAERVTGWHARADAAAERLAAVPALPESLGAAAAATLGSLDRARAQLAAMEKQGYARPQEIDELEGNLRMAELAPATLSRVAEAAAAGQPFVALPVRAITNARILPTELAVPVLETAGLQLAACRGERETASFTILALEDLKGLTVTAAPLQGDGTTIPARAVDLKLVKVWYQAGRGIGDLRHRLLVPELLLNDDALVRVDEEQQHNYLRSTAPDGTTTYLLASDPEPTGLDGVRPVDAATLQPLDLAARRVQQYWVTLQAPADAPAGTYRGALRVQTADGRGRELPLQLTVHDFDLAPAPLTYSIYYRAKLAADNQPTITSEQRSEEQYLAELKNMAAHGVLHPTLYQGYDETLLPRALELRAEAGLSTDKLFTLGLTTGAPQTASAVEQLRGRVRQWLAMAQRFGYDQLYIYGIDEAKGERLAAQRAAWKAVREDGAKTFVACYLGTFEAIGDLLDVAVLARQPDPAEAAKYHGVGSQVFTYAYPQVGPEEPETFRRNYGLVLWQANFDGAMDYAYQHGFGHVWNDFDSHQYRDHNFTYPTVNGVVDTVQWSGFREAVDDTRYLATLQAAMARCADPKIAAAAQAWLDSLDPQRDLDELRAEMVARIEDCLGAR